MPVNDGETITTIFPSDHSGKLSKIIPHQPKVLSQAARGKGFKRHPLPLAHPHPGLEADLSTLRRRGSFYFALTEKDSRVGPISNPMRVPGLLRKSHATKQVLESGVRLHQIETLVDFQEWDATFALRKGLLQPQHGVVPVAQRRVNLGNLKRRNELGSRPCTQFLHYLLRLADLA